MCYLIPRGHPKKPKHHHHPKTPVVFLYLHIIRHIPLERNASPDEAKVPSTAFFLKIYLLERERERESGHVHVSVGEGQRERIFKLPAEGGARRGALSHDQ